MISYLFALCGYPFPAVRRKKKAGGKMRVVKVLNNSLVLALDEDGRETILMGKGIGFHKAAGYEFQKEEVEKVFVLKDRSISRSIIRLAAETDSVYFELAKSVIDYAIERYGMRLLDHIYLSLTDHLAFAVKRQREQIEVPNFYTMEMKKFNPNEYQVGIYALEQVKRKLDVELPSDEAGNIAFHFINAQVDPPYNDKNRVISRVTENVLEIVQYYFKLVYEEESTSYSRYVTHVRLFAQRLVSGQLLPEESSRLLYDQIAEACVEEFACVDKIAVYVKETFGIALTNQEAMYLALHIHRVLEEGRH